MNTLSGIGSMEVIPAADLGTITRGEHVFQYDALNSITSIGTRPINHGEWVSDMFMDFGAFFKSMLYEDAWN